MIALRGCVVNKSVNASAVDHLRVAVIVPCYNEELAVAKVVSDFAAALPQATIYVYDNNSKDRTAEVARQAGAIVRTEKRKGKGNVVRRMFADVSADVYILVDGDDTYDAFAAPTLIQRMVDEQLDMVVGLRRHGNAKKAYRPGHEFGNWMLTSLVNWAFGAKFADMLSGYRVMSRRFVKSFPALSSGFEIETELNVHTLEIGASVEEVPTTYKERPPGSASKLNSIRDGLRILRLITRLVREERPMEFFGISALVCASAAVFLGVPIFLEYLQSGLVPRQPTWMAAIGLGVLSFLSLTCGLVLDGVTKGRREARRIAYLSLPEPHHAPEATLERALGATVA
jgi:glycosyltransferase involved in cell wall biosynthesis